MNTKDKTQNPDAAADLPQPAPTLAPETVVEQLRVMRGQIGEVSPLTPAQRKTLRNQTRTTNQILQASINVIGALDNIAQAVGQPADNVRQLFDEANRWTAVEDELRGMLNGVAGANLIRRQVRRFRESFLTQSALVPKAAQGVAEPLPLDALCLSSRHGIAP